MLISNRLNGLGADSTRLVGQPVLLWGNHIINGVALPVLLQKCIFTPQRMLDTESDTALTHTSRGEASQTCILSFHGHFLESLSPLICFLVKSR